MDWHDCLLYDRTVLKIALQSVELTNANTQGGIPMGDYRTTFRNCPLLIAGLMLWALSGLTASAQETVHELGLGFEESTIPTGWHVSRSDDLSFAIVRDVKKSGSAAGLFDIPVKGRKVAYPGLSYSIAGIAIPDGETWDWELSYDIKTELASGPHYAAVEYINAKGVRYNFKQGCFAKGKNDWREMKMSGQIGERSRKVTLKLIMHGEGKAWVDDIRFTIKRRAADLLVNHPVNHRRPGQVIPAEPEADFDEFIRVAKDNWTFEGSRTGKPFIPLGTNLVFPFSYKDGKPVKVGAGMWKEELFDLARLEQIFKMMGQLNVNVAKIALTGKSFLPGVTGVENFKIDPGALKRFEQVLALAKKYKVRLWVAAPNHWDGWPSPWWEDEVGESPRMLPVLVKFWEAFAPRYKNETAIFGYSLCIEKGVVVPHLSGSWNKHYRPVFVSFLKKKYTRLSTLNRSWKTKLKSWDQVNFAKDECDYDSNQLFDSQLFREHLCVTWVKEQTEAIRKGAPDHMVGSGWIHSFPLHRSSRYTRGAKEGSPYGYGAMIGREATKYLDFLDPHFYPRGDSEKVDMEKLKGQMRYLYTGKPLILGEFSTMAKEEVPRVNKLIIESTIGLVSGWTPWAFHNPGVGDSLTTAGGLVENDMTTVTEWGKTFRNLKQDLMLNSRAGIARDTNTPVTIELDRRKLLCGKLEDHGGATAKEVKDIVRAGGRNVRFTENTSSHGSEKRRE